MEVFHVIRRGIVYEFVQDDGQGFIVKIPALPGCISHGRSFEEAMEMIEDAMAGWLAVAKKRRLSIPPMFASP
jgi:predicted RNase H-like HicB family nuclease